MSDYIIDINTGIYRITKDGKVFSQSKLKIPLVGKGMQHTGEFKLILKPERELTTRINNRGYNTVSFNNTTYMVHNLVAQGFVPNPDNKPEVNHINGNKLNNNYTNLEWVTRKENIQHAFRTGLNKAGLGTKQTYKSIETKQKSLANLKDKSVLTEEQVIFCRSVYKPRHSKFGASALGRQFGISSVAMANVVNYKTYKHIK
jgi:hypothetical protein